MKSVALFSGGLDSLLAVKIIQLQKIKVIPITFISYFFDDEKARNTSNANGLELVTLNISHEHFKMLIDPEYGYGRGMNPCVDCHALMIKQGYNYLKKIGGKFLITGDVVGQRSKSQTSESILKVDKLTGLGDITLRPLSAKLLEPTTPERLGIVNRDKLHGIQGRSRKKQRELAKKFKITEYTSPGGGCRLTNKIFSKRLRIAIKQCCLNESKIKFIKLGRHFRLNESLFIVSRNEEEGDLLKEYSSDLFELIDTKGPKGKLLKCSEDFMGQKEIDEDDDNKLAARILARYAKDGKDIKVRIPDLKAIKVNPLNKYICEKLIIT